MTVGLLAFVVVGYVVGFFALARGLTDLERIPRRAWTNTGYQSRGTWRTGMLVGFAAAGWPAVGVVAAWRFSEARAAVREESKLLHAAREEERQRRHEIVLADYEHDAEHSAST
jgi:hypothetical protein